MKKILYQILGPILGVSVLYSGATYIRINTVIMYSSRQHTVLSKQVQIACYIAL